MTAAGIYFDDHFDWLSLAWDIAGNRSRLGEVEKSILMVLCRIVDSFER